MCGGTVRLIICALCVFLLRNQSNFATASDCVSNAEKDLTTILTSEDDWKPEDSERLDSLFARCPGVNVQPFLSYIGQHRNVIEIVKILKENGVINSGNAGSNGDINFWFTAMEQDKMRMLKDLLNPGLDLKDKEYTVARAVRENSTKLMQFLIDHGASIHATDYVLQTALKQKNPELLKLLFANGAAIERNEDVMSKGVEQNSTELLKILYDNGGYVRNNSYILWRAVVQRNPELLKFLFASDAVVGADSTAMSTAVERNDTELLEILFANGAYISENRITEKIVRMNNPKLLRMLFANGAAIPDETVLNQSELSKILTDNGANTSFSISIWKKILKKNITKLLESIFAEGVAIPRDEFPMNTALEQNNPELLRLIFNHGADKNRNDHRVEAIFNVRNIIWILKVLLANFESPQKKASIWSWVVAQNRPELIRDLVDSGETVPEEFMTPQIKAALRLRPLRPLLLFFSVSLSVSMILTFLICTNIEKYLPRRSVP